jgi:hypothetical protein
MNAKLPISVLIRAVMKTAMVTANATQGSSVMLSVNASQVSRMTDRTYVGLVRTQCSNIPTATQGSGSLNLHDTTVKTSLPRCLSTWTSLRSKIMLTNKQTPKPNG